MKEKKKASARAIVTGPKKGVLRFASTFVVFANASGIVTQQELIDAPDEDFSQLNMFALEPATLELEHLLAFLGIPPHASLDHMTDVDVIFDVVTDGQALRFRKENEPNDEAGCTARLGEPPPSLEIFSEWADTLANLVPAKVGLPILCNLISNDNTPEDRLLLLHAIAVQRSALSSWEPSPDIIIRLSKLTAIKPKTNSALWAEDCWAAGSAYSGTSIADAAYPSIIWIESLVQKNATKH